MRLPSSSIAAACAVLFAVAAAPAGAAQGPTPEPTLQPGSYAQVLPGTKKFANPGNQVVLVRGRSGRLAFSVNAIRALDENQGFVAGTLPGGGRRVVWEQRAAGANCRLTFTATADGLTIGQDAAFGDCGFGYGVIADGAYQRRPADGLPPVP